MGKSLTEVIVFIIFLYTLFTNCKHHSRDNYASKAESITQNARGIMRALQTSSKMVSFQDANSKVADLQSQNSFASVDLLHFLNAQKVKIWR